MKKNTVLQICTVLLSLSIFFLASIHIAQARESIIAFDVTAELLQDSSLRITERIRVNIEHKAIKRGIYRVLPMSQWLANNKFRSHSHTFESITFDGEEIPYAKAARSGNVAVAIGNEKALAPLGEHVYEIRYTTTNHVLFLENRDEIYFNVTGNDWTLPIDEASFTFLVPGGVDNILETTAFTGPRGAKGGNFVMESKNVFRTTRPMAVGEGLTVAVAWKPGLVDRPYNFRVGWIADNREVCVLFVFGLIFLYYFFCRRFLKETPPPVFPIFSAPEGMSPGYVSALKDIRNAGRMLHADMVGAAVNGFLSLDMKDAKNIVLHKTEPKVMPKKWIASYCQTAAHYLTKPENPCDLKTREGKIQVGEAIETLETWYNTRQKNMWRSSLLLKLGGWVGAFVVASFISLVVDYPETLGETKLMYPVSVAVLYLMSGGGLLALGAAKKKSRFIIFRLGYAILVPMLLLLGSGMVWAQMEGSDFWILRQIAWLYVMAFLMWRLPDPSRTPEAMKEYSQILGLEMYIRAAEKHRLAMINAPEDTIEKYEEILPYAVALGCADAWQKRFDPLLRKIDYAPEWVDDKSLVHRDYSRVVSAVTTTSAMGTALAACIAANHAASRTIGGSGFSSGGSSGGRSGGSSGGGSGGGGGGGW